MHHRPKQLTVKINESISFITPPHMLRTVMPDGSIKIDPLARSAKGRWRKALDGTRGGDLLSHIQKAVEEAYMRHVVNVLLSEDNEDQCQRS